MSDWKPTPDCNDRCYGEPCVHRAGGTPSIDAVNPEPPGLREIVDSIDYMPGWMAYLGRDNEGGGWLTLHIISKTPDSYHPEQSIRVNHSFLVPMATYNERTWKAWILERYIDVWRHETGEFLKFDGVREFAPHHGNGENPYITWHVGDLADTEVRAGETKDG